MSCTSRPRQRRGVVRVAAAVATVATTVLAVAACGASVTGSPQPNAAAVTTTAPTSTAPTSTASTSTAPATPTGPESTARTSETSARTSVTTPTELSDVTKPTELTEPTVPTEPTELTGPTELTFPSDLGAIPGFSSECGAVSIAYLAVAFAPLSALGGSDQFDAAELQNALAELNASAEVPAELAPDFQVLGELAAESNGAGLEQAGELFGSERFTTASDHISNWLDANCG